MYFVILRRIALYIFVIIIFSSCSTLDKKDEEFEEAFTGLPHNLYLIVSDDLRVKDSFEKELKGMLGNYDIVALTSKGSDLDVEDRFYLKVFKEKVEEEKIKDVKNSFKHNKLVWEFLNGDKVIYHYENYVLGSPADWLANNSEVIRKSIAMAIVSMEEILLKNLKIQSIDANEMPRLFIKINAPKLKLENRNIFKNILAENLRSSSISPMFLSRDDDKDNYLKNKGLFLEISILLLSDDKPDHNYLKLQWDYYVGGNLVYGYNQGNLIRVSYLEPKNWDKLSKIVIKAGASELLQFMSEYVEKVDKSNKEFRQIHKNLEIPSNL